MRRLGHALIASSMLFAACGKGADEVVPQDTTQAAALEPAEPAGRLDGTLRLDDAWLKVRPFVAHSARLDLVTQCLNRRDDEEKAGKPPAPLCFEYAKRDRASVRTIRVELGHASVGDAMKELREKNESAHLGIEKNGSYYQYLDLIHANRRADAYQSGEVRVLASGADGRKYAEPLVADLLTLFPGSTVDYVERAK